MLEGGVQGELQQQVFGRGQSAQLAAADAAARPQALPVEREEAGGGDDAAVQLHDPAPARVAEGPRVVAARHLDEAGLAQRLDPLRPAFEREHVHVRHRPVRLDVVDGLREDRPLQGQAAEAARLEEPEGPRGEAHLAERPREVGAAPGHERLPERCRPVRPVALDRGEQKPGKALIARGLRQLRRRDVLGEGRKGAGGQEAPQQAPRL